MMYPNLNTNVDMRERIIFGDKKYDKEKYPGGIRRFSGMSYDTLKQLVDNNFADVNDTQNDSPSIEEFMEYAKTHPHVTFEGYAVELDRDDYRVSIETINQDFSKDENRAGAIADFSEKFHAADEFIISENRGHAWWD